MTSPFSWKRRHSFSVICVVLGLWLIAEVAWLQNVPDYVLSESVMYQNDAVDLYRTLQSDGWWGLWLKVSTLDAPTSPLLDVLAAVCLSVHAQGPWPWFTIQFFVLVLLVWGCECLGSLMHTPRTGLYSALTLCSLLTIEGYLRNYYVELSLAAVLTWTYWAYLKSDHFTKTRFNMLFALLTLVGMMCKWSYFPLYEGFFLGCLLLRSLIKRTLTKGDVLNLALYTAGVTIPAYCLYYHASMDAILRNYMCNTTLTHEASYLTDWHFYWYCLGKYLILLMRSDYLPIAGTLSLVAFVFTLVQPRRFQANLEPLLLLILPNIVILFLHFDAVVPRYLVGCIGIQCVLIGSILGQVRHHLGLIILTLMLAAKAVFLGAWMIPELQIPTSNYDYLDSDVFRVSHSRNVFSIMPKQSEEPLTLAILANILLGARQNWCTHLNSDWFADLKRYGIFTGTFTSPPYRMPWLSKLDNALASLAQETAQQRNNPRGWLYSKRLCVATYTNETRNSITLRYAVNHSLAMNKVWKCEIELCHDYGDTKEYVLAPERAEALKVIVMALSLGQLNDAGFPWPRLSLMERRQAIVETITEQLGPNWYVYAFYPSLRQHVLPPAALSQEFDLVIVREKT